MAASPIGPPKFDRLAGVKGQALGVRDPLACAEISAKERKGHHRGPKSSPRRKRIHLVLIVLFRSCRRFPLYFKRQAWRGGNNKSVSPEAEVGNLKGVK
jgi:hypothetical protein